jgi:hypothetical protein
MGICIAAQILCVAGLLALILAGDGRTWPIFALLVLFGTARLPRTLAIDHAQRVPTAELATAILVLAGGDDPGPSRAACLRRGPAAVRRGGPAGLHR